MIYINALKYFTAGYNELADNVDVLNKINVFPIPDKDTGTNMERTMRTFTLSSSDISKNILYNARGSSGNILAIFFIGFFSNEESSIKDCIKNGYEKVLNTISNIKEGTIVSLFRVCSEIEYISDKQYINDCVNQCIFEWLDGPNKLDILKKYNTYDSGALGFLFILDGINVFLGNKSISYKLHRIIDDIEISDYIDNFPRYCLEFTINNEIKEDYLSSFGNEIICIYNGIDTHVHIHTDVPNIVLDEMKVYGNISDIKIDDNKKDQ